MRVANTHSLREMFGTGEQESEREYYVSKEIPHTKTICTESFVWTFKRLQRYFLWRRNMATNSEQETWTVEMRA